MIYVVAALVVMMLSTLFFIRSLRREATFVPLHTFEGKQRVVHHLGSVNKGERNFECYVIEEQ